MLVFNVPYEHREITVARATHETEVAEWVSQRKGDEMGDVGLVSYWRVGEKSVHTVGVSIGRHVLVVDVERIGDIPNGLKRFLKRKKVWGFNIRKQFRMLKKTKGFGIPYMRRVTLESDLDREVVKARLPGTFSNEAVVVTALDAYQCFSKVLIFTRNQFPNPNQPSTSSPLHR